MPKGKVLQEQLQERARTIKGLEQTVQQQVEELQWTQRQLLDTQSSLIELETHLTSLEDEQAEQAAATTLPHPTQCAMPAVSSDDISDVSNAQQAAGTKSQKFPLRPDLLQHPPAGDDEVQSAFVNTIDSLFPPSSAGSEPDSTDYALELHEDPLELFEKGKAAVEGRARKQPQRKKMRMQQATKPGTQSERPAAGSTNSDASTQPKGKRCCFSQGGCCSQHA